MRIRTRDSYKPREGFFTILLRDEKTKKLIRRIRGKNVITFIGADALAKIWGGDTDFFPSHIYGEHADPGGSGYVEGSLNGLSADKSDDITVLRSFPRDTSDAEEQIIQTTFSTTDIALYSNNITNFTSSFANPANNGRIFVGAGVISKVGAAELLVAHSYFPAFIKPVGSEIIIIWSFKFI